MLNLFSLQTEALGTAITPSTDTVVRLAAADTQRQGAAPPSFLEHWLNDLAAEEQTGNGLPLPGQVSPMPDARLQLPSQFNGHPGTNTRNPAPLPIPNQPVTERVQLLPPVSSNPVQPTLTPVAPADEAVPAVVNDVAAKLRVANAPVITPAVTTTVVNPAAVKPPVVTNADLRAARTPALTVPTTTLNTTPDASRPVLEAAAELAPAKPDASRANRTTSTPVPIVTSPVVATSPAEPLERAALAATTTSAPQWAETPTSVAPVDKPLPTAAPATSAPLQTASAELTTANLRGIDVAVDTKAWGDQLGDRVMMMAGNRVQNAEIRLSPAELGPLRVQVSVEDSVATVNFQAHNAVTREAIEQAMPRLREMFVENGLTLTQANIGEQGAQQGADGDQQDGPGAAAAQPDGVDTEDATRESPLVSRGSGSGRVDTFA
ncbi:MAG: flagellar hook-length control protein FliK [Pseudomonadota bacterium]